MNKRGMSGVVTTIILIGISLAVVGVVWYTINYVIQQASEDVESKSAGIESILSGTSAPASCLATLNAGYSVGDGVYSIDPDGEGGNSPFEVYCDMTNGGWTLYSSDPEYSIVDDSTDANYKLMKSIKVPDIFDSLNIKFEGYIKSGNYYWAWKIGKNGGSTLTLAESGEAKGSFNSHLDTGQSPSVHQYRNFSININPNGLNQGDLLELWMVSSTSGGVPVNGNGQILYAKNFKVYFR